MWNSYNDIRKQDGIAAIDNTVLLWKQKLDLIKGGMSYDDTNNIWDHSLAPTYPLCGDARRYRTKGIFDCSRCILQHPMNCDTIERKYERATTNKAAISGISHVVSSLMEVRTKYVGGESN